MLGSFSAFLKPSLFVGLIIVLFSVFQISSAGLAVEERLGLSFLFHLRGEQPPPTETIVVGITPETASQLNLPKRMENWPRMIYGDLVRKLNLMGARVIVFDIYFSEAKEGDEVFAEALSNAGNVVLFSRSERETLLLENAQRILVDRIAEPTDLLAAASTNGPFVLPKVPTYVSRFHTRIDLQPTRWTLPVLALKYFSSKPEHEIMDLLVDQAAIRWLNFYGPPRHITTLDLHKVIKNPEVYRDQFNGAAVFVGYSARFQPHQRDGFITTYSGSDGLDISGVELVATAFANLLRESDIRPLNWRLQMVITAAYLIVIFFIVMWLTPVKGIPAALLAAGLYSRLVFHAFENYYIWLPWSLPVFILTPLLILIGGFHHWRRSRTLQQQLRSAFANYVPESAINQLLAAGQDSRRKTLSGICLVTDAQNYTTLAERLPAHTLATSMERYYEAIFKPIRSAGGVISDVAGDGIIALWPCAEISESLRQRLMIVLQEIVESVAAYNKANPSVALPTRIGVHAGEIVLGPIGALDHFEYRAVGDIVNTASRIESLNKTLSTQTLISEESVPQDLPESARKVGSFQLKGKNEPVTVYEVSVNPLSKELKKGFEEGIQKLQEKNMPAAKACFQKLAEAFPEDGPTQFYLKHCTNLSRRKSDREQKLVS